MSRRTVVLFWGALAAAVFFLGSAWTAAGALSGPHGLGNAIVLVVSGGGCLAAAFVAGRIAFVIGRAQRKGRGS